MRFHYSFSKYFIHQNSSSQGHLNIQLLVCAFFALKKKKKKMLKERTLHLCFWMKVPKST